MISESCIVNYSNLYICKYTLVGCRKTIFQSKTFNLVLEWVQSCTTVLPSVTVPTPSETAVNKEKLEESLVCM